MHQECSSDPWIQATSCQELGALRQSLYSLMEEWYWCQYTSSPPLSVDCQTCLAPFIYLSLSLVRAFTYTLPLLPCLFAWSRIDEGAFMSHKMASALFQILSGARHCKQPPNVASKAAIMSHFLRTHCHVRVQVSHKPILWAAGAGPQTKSWSMLFLGR